MSKERPHPLSAEKHPELGPWKPPVNQEFERFGEAYFISVAPHFMPRWLVHADPRRLVANSPETWSLLQLIRPAAFTCAAIATWCLRKSWTVGVERRDVAGAGDWKFVLREERRSFSEALERRDVIVDDWRNVILPGNRARDYAPLPFLAEVTAGRHDTTTPS